MARLRGVVWTLAIALAAGLAACSNVIDSATPPSASTHETPTASRCTAIFTPPPYEALSAVAGLSIRAIDSADIEIRNTTDHSYFYAVIYWETSEDLVCGRGLVPREGSRGEVRSRSTIVVEGGSTSETPATVSVWSEPCGEGCVRAPTGEYLIPGSSIAPPTPEAT